MGFFTVNEDSGGGEVGKIQTGLCQSLATNHLKCFSYKNFIKIFWPRLRYNVEIRVTTSDIVIVLQT